MAGLRAGYGVKIDRGHKMAELYTNFRGGQILAEKSMKSGGISA